MFQLGEAQEKIAELNEKLARKCPNLSLELDFHSRFKTRENVSIYEHMIRPQIILCLNHMPNNSCISSIACKINKANKTMEISSKTHESHEGKKYNTLLRSAILMAASHIKYKMGNGTSSKTKSKSRSKKSKTKSKSRRNKVMNVAQIISRSINPVSTLLLVKYFGAGNAELDEFIDENEYDRSELTLDQIKEFQQEVNTDEMTSSEELEYMENNKNYGEPLLLNINLLDSSVAEKIEDTFESTLRKVVC